MSIDQSSSQSTPTRVRWQVFTLAFGTSGILYWHRYVFAFVKPSLAEEWELTNTDLGRLDSAFSLSYTAFQFPLGIAADVWGVRLVLTLLMLVWCLGLGLLAAAPNVRWLAFAQTLIGGGQSAVYASLTRIARVWYPPAVRTTMQGLVSVLAGRLGALSSSLVFTTVLLGLCGLSWRSSVAILVTVGLVHCGLFLMLFRNSPAGHPGVNDAERLLIEGCPPAQCLQETSVKESESSETAVASETREAGAGGGASKLRSWIVRVRSIPPAARRTLAWLALQTILSTFADNLYSNWIPQFLSQVHQLEFKRMGIFAALPLLGGALAGLLGGVLNDRLIALTGNRRWSRSGVALVGKMLAALFLFAALTQYHRPYVFCSFLFFVKLFGDWSVTSTLGVVTDMGGRATASVFAFNNTIAGIGLIGAPLVFGPMADHWGWPAVFICVSSTYVLCALTWLAIDCTQSVDNQQA